MEHRENPYAASEVENSQIRAAEDDAPDIGRWAAMFNRYTARFYVANAVLGFFIGAVSRALRDSPWTTARGVHFEAIGELAIKILLCGLFLIACWSNGVLSRIKIYLGNTLLLWVAALVGWSIENGSAWHAYVNVNGGWMLGCALVGTMLLALRRR